MALIGSDFQPEALTYNRRCSECGKKMQKGDNVLVSRRFGKVQKRVCSEECRLEFDNNYWQERARQSREKPNAR